MWIRSQNKQVLIDADKIEIFKSKRNEYIIGTRWGQRRSFMGLKTICYTLLGIYSTAEEAYKVMDMLQEHAEGINTVEKQIASFAGDYKRCFQMPPSEEREEGKK